MLYAHWSDVPWEKDRCPDFKPNERNLACPCCGEFYLSIPTMDAVQRMRSLLKSSITINSGHRCRYHNRKVGGALNSEHLKIALDIRISKHKPADLLECARQAGFTTFGFYGTFLHTDLRPGRRWITNQGKITWNGLVNF